MPASSDPSRLRTVFAACNSLSDGVVVVDSRRVITYMNAAARRLLAAPAAGRARSCRKTLRCGTTQEPNRCCERCRVSALLSEPGESARFTAAVGQPGRRVWVEATCSPIAGRERSVALVMRQRASAEPADDAVDESQWGLSLQTKAVLQGLVRSARELLVADYTALGRLDISRLEVVWLVQDGSRCPSTGAVGVPLGQGIRGRVVSTGESVYIPDFPNHAPDLPENHPTMQSEGLRAALAVPVLIHDEPVGVLMVASRSPAEYSPEKTQVLRNLAGLAGEVLNHSDWVVGAQAASIRAERSWLAAELHDGLAQLLGAITQRLKLARWVLGRSTDALTLAADLQEVLELSERAHQELRLALGDLRTPATEGDFRQALETTLLTFSERSRLVVELIEVPVTRPAIPPAVSLQILRILQEALTNARKHSGGRRVWVRWTYADSRHTFTVQDDGQGFISQEVGHGFGMTIMADRARRIGGDLRVYGAPESGCTVVFTVPDRSGGG